MKNLFPGNSLLATTLLAFVLTIGSYANAVAAPTAA